MEDNILHSKAYGEYYWKDRKRRLGLPLSFTRYILTPTKLYSSIGFFNVQEERTELYRVIDFSLQLPLFQRIFGCGTIVVRAKDKSNPELYLKSVKRPRQVMSILEECVEQERLKYNIHGRDMVGASGMSDAVDDDCDHN